MEFNPLLKTSEDWIIVFWSTESVIQIFVSRISFIPGNPLELRGMDIYQKSTINSDVEGSQKTMWLMEKVAWKLIKQLWLHRPQSELWCTTLMFRKLLCTIWNCCTDCLAKCQHVDWSYNQR